MKRRVEMGGSLRMSLLYELLSSEDEELCNVYPYLPSLVRASNACSVLLHHVTASNSVKDAHRALAATEKQRKRAHRRSIDVDDTIPTCIVQHIYYASFPAEVSSFWSSGRYRSLAGTESARHREFKQARSSPCGGEACQVGGDGEPRTQSLLRIFSSLGTRRAYSRFRTVYSL
jgi:hypothetical protein